MNSSLTSFWYTASKNHTAYTNSPNYPTNTLVEYVKFLSIVDRWEMLKVRIKTKHTKRANDQRQDPNKYSKYLLKNYVSIITKSEYLVKELSMYRFNCDLVLVKNYPT